MGKDARSSHSSADEVREQSRATLKRIREERDAARRATAPRWTPSRASPGTDKAAAEPAKRGGTARTERSRKPAPTPPPADGSGRSRSSRAGKTPPAQTPAQASKERVTPPRWTPTRGLTKSDAPASTRSGKAMAATKPAAPRAEADKTAGTSTRARRSRAATPPAAEPAPRPARPARWTPTRASRTVTPTKQPAPVAGETPAPTAARPATAPNPIPRRVPLATTGAASRIAAAVVEATREAVTDPMADAEPVASAPASPAAKPTPPRASSRKVKTGASPPPPTVPLDRLVLVDATLQTRFAAAGIDTVNGLAALSTILGDLAEVINVPAWLKLAEGLIAPAPGP